MSLGHVLHVSPTGQLHTIAGLRPKTIMSAARRRVPEHITSGNFWLTSQHSSDVMTDCAITSPDARAAFEAFMIQSGERKRHIEASLHMIRI